MFGRGNGGFLGEILAVEAEVDAIEELAEGDPFAAMEDMAAAREFERGNFTGGFVDEMIADVF